MEYSFTVDTLVAAVVDSPFEVTVAVHILSFSLLLADYCSFAGLAFLVAAYAVAAFAFIVVAAWAVVAFACIVIVAWVAVVAWVVAAVVAAWEGTVDHHPFPRD